MRRPLDSASSSASPPPPPPTPSTPPRELHLLTIVCPSLSSCFQDGSDRRGSTGRRASLATPPPPHREADQSDHAPPDPLRVSNHQQQKQSGFCVYIDPLEFRGPFNLLINLHADGSFCCSDAKKPKPLKKKKKKSSKRRGRILLFAQFCCDFYFFCFRTHS